MMVLRVAWRSAQFVSPDGVSYMDMAAALRAGQFDAARNLYWSPGYPALLALAEALVDPGPAARYPLAHAVNVVIAVVGLATLASLARMLRASRPELAHDQGTALALRALAAASGAWLFARLAPVLLITPDPLVATLVLLIVAQVVALGLRPSHASANRRACVLGATAGAGFAVKSAMFFIGLGFLACIPLALRNGGASWRSAVRAGAAGLLAWVAIVAPQVATLSARADGFTIGKSGDVVYAWFINDVPYDRIWRGLDSTLGVPRHHAPRVHERPAVYAIDAAVGGTFPVWYQPTHWFAGVSPRFSPTAQARAAARNTLSYVVDLLPFLVAAAVLLIATRSQRRTVPALAAAAPAILPCLAGLAMYALIYTERRYVGAFYVVLVLVVMTPLAALASVRSPRAARATVLALAGAIVVVEPVRFVLARRMRGQPLSDAPVSASARATRVRFDVAAESLRVAGVPPNARIAVVADGYDAAWAQLNGQVIVALVDTAPAVLVTAALPASVQRALFTTGATWLVAVAAEVTSGGPGWRRVGHTDLWVHPIASPGSMPSVPLLPSVPGARDSSSADAPPRTSLRGGDHSPREDVAPHRRYLPRHAVAREPVARHQRRGGPEPFAASVIARE